MLLDAGRVFALLNNLNAQRRNEQPLFFLKNGVPIYALNLRSRPYLRSLRSSRYVADRDLILKRSKCLDPGL